MITRLALALQLALVLAVPFSKCMATEMVFGGQLRVVLVDDKLSQADADRVFTYAKSWLYGHDHEYDTALAAFQTVSERYGGELSDDCAYWSAKCYFAMNGALSLKVIYYLDQLEALYSNGNVYRSRDLVEFVKLVAQSRAAPTTWGHPSSGGIFLLYDYAKRLPRATPDDIATVRAAGRAFLLSAVARVDGGGRSWGGNSPCRNPGSIGEASFLDMMVPAFRNTMTGYEDWAQQRLVDLGFTDDYYRGLLQGTYQRGEYSLAGESWSPDNSRYYRDFLCKFPSPTTCPGIETVTPAIVTELLGG